MADILRIRPISVFHNKPTDLIPQPRVEFPSDSSEPGTLQSDILAMAEPLFERVDSEATRTIAWYYSRRRVPAVLARGIRLLAILLTVAGGLVPLMTPEVPVPSEWGYILLAFAGALVALDRFAGFSSAWMRYIDAAMRLGVEQQRFRIEWSRLKADATLKISSPELVDRAFTLLQTFSAATDTLVRKETELWVDEFRSVLSTLGRREAAASVPSTAEETAAATSTEAQGHFRLPTVRMSALAPAAAEPQMYFIRFPEGQPFRVYRTMAPDREPDYVSRVLPNVRIAALDAHEMSAIIAAGAEVIPSRRYAPVASPLNRVYRPLSNPNLGSLDDVLKHIHAPQAWTLSRGKGVHVAVIDTGVDGSLKEIPKWKRSPFSWPMSGEPWVDDVGHGSMCSTIAVGTKIEGGRYDGVAPEAELIACRTSFDETELVRIYEHLILLVRQKKIGRLVINNSYGAYQCTPTGMRRDHPFPEVVRRAVDEGIVVVFAAGNNHVVVCGHEASECGPQSIWGANSLDEVLSVGTVNRENRMSDNPLTQGGYSHRDSSRGPGELAAAMGKPDCVAPTYGDVVWGGGYQTMEWWGTSGAAPQVAGLAALLLSADPTLTVAQVYHRIRRSCVDIGLMPACGGAGLINCEIALDGS